MTKFVKLTMIRNTILNELEQEVEVTTPVAVNVEMIRSFNERRAEKPGTRMTFNNGTGFAVQESPDEVMGLVSGQAGAFLALAAPGAGAPN